MGGLASGGEKLQPLRAPLYRDWALISLAGLVFGLDQVTKYLVRITLDFQESIPAKGSFRIVHTYNTGSAFGLFQDQTLPLILASLVGIAILLVVYRHASLPGALLRLSLGLQLGGAMGNLLDRVRMGHVTDFIGLGFWPVFNLADASIVVGIIILIWLLARPKKGPLQTAPAGPYATVGARPEARLTASPSPFCPLCDSPMLNVPHGRRCYGCGALERLEVPGEPPRGDGSDYP